MTAPSTSARTTAPGAFPAPSSGTFPFGPVPPRKGSGIPNASLWEYGAPVRHLPPVAGCHASHPGRRGCCPYLGHTTGCAPVPTGFCLHAGARAWSLQHSSVPSVSDRNGLAASRAAEGLQPLLPTQASRARLSRRPAGRASRPAERLACPSSSNITRSFSRA